MAINSRNTALTYREMEGSSSSVFLNSIHHFHKRCCLAVHKRCCLVLPSLSNEESLCNNTTFFSPISGGGGGVNNVLSMDSEICDELSGDD